jgi:hypothetical protein
MRPFASKSVTAKLSGICADLQLMRRRACGKAGATVHLSYGAVLHAFNYQVLAAAGYRVYEKIPKRKTAPIISKLSKKLASEL